VDPRNIATWTLDIYHASDSNTLTTTPKQPFWLQAYLPILKHKLIDQQSGWQSGRELDFYPSNPGSTPARVPSTKKNYKKKSIKKITSKLPSVPFMTSSRKAYLKKKY